MLCDLSDWEKSLTKGITKCQVNQVAKKMDFLHWSVKEPNFNWHKSLDFLHPIINYTTMYNRYRYAAINRQEKNVPYHLSLPGIV